MLYLYNQYFSFFSRLKKLLGKPARGPEGVFKSLTLGLSNLKQPFTVNSKTIPIETACVLSGVAALRWAIVQKQKGLIKKIIAGPNIVVTPEEGKGILKAAEIDKVIVPSRWVKDFYISLAPQLSAKLLIWRAGVSLPEQKEVKKEYDFLIFDKLPNADLQQNIKAYLDSQNQTSYTIKYGDISQNQFFELLEKSRFMVYLSESESQGLAMFEAWARNVPTLVWERGFLLYNNHRWEGDTATPYLTSSTGMAFKDLEDFKRMLPEFQGSKFSPREWIENNATNEIAAKNYLEIVNQ